VYGPHASVADLPEEVHENLRVGALIRSGYGKRMAFIAIFWTCSIVPLFAVYAFGPKILGALGLTGGLATMAPPSSPSCSASAVWRRCSWSTGSDGGR
jgi:MFS transporter, putative metabolite transport protein